MKFEAKLSLFPEIFVLVFLCGHELFYAYVVHAHNPLLQPEEQAFLFLS